MKIRFQKSGKKAFTRRDLITIIAAVAILAVILIFMIVAVKHSVLRVQCLDNLKEISLASRDWEGDNNNYYPMQLSVTNGGAMEMVATGGVAHCFQVMSNELAMATPRILICPADRKHVPATNWTTDFNNSHISYFINSDASEAYPQELLMGDDNFAINGIPVKSGLLLLTPNAPISWAGGRHGRVNNISFSDGSEVGESSSGLQNALQLSLQGTPITTNRIVIP